jgi:hypothetical protein
MILNSTTLWTLCILFWGQAYSAGLPEMFIRYKVQPVAVVLLDQICVLFDVFSLWG